MVGNSVITKVLKSYTLIHCVTLILQWNTHKKQILNVFFLSIHWKSVGSSVVLDSTDFYWMDKNFKIYILCVSQKS